MWGGTWFCSLCLMNSMSCEETVFWHGSCETKESASLKNESEFKGGKNMKANKENTAGAEEGIRETVILIHGLIRKSRSMAPMAKALGHAGYRILNLEYPSTDLSIEELSEVYLRPLVDRALQYNGPIHFVTHSMGGIIVRFHFSRHGIQRPGRVVMLAPPNGGSELVDVFKKNFIFKKILGPAGQQLSTADEALPQRLGPAEFELGVIAGNLSFNPLSPWLLDDFDDGKVAVRRTMVAGMRDMLVVPCNHTFIMRSPKVIRQTLNFLQSGKFAKT